MPAPKPTAIFDGHNDVLLRLHRRASAEAVTAFLQGEDKGHLDLPKARRGGFAGGLFAIFVPSPKRENSSSSKTPAPDNGGVIGNDPAPPAVDAADAQRTVFAMVVALVPDRTRIAGPRSRLPQCRRYRKLPRRRRAGGGAAYRGRRGDRREFRTFGCAPRGRTCARSARSGAGRMRSAMACRFAVRLRPTSAPA